MLNKINNIWGEGKGEMAKIFREECKPFCESCDQIGWQSPVWNTNGSWKHQACKPAPLSAWYGQTACIWTLFLPYQYFSSISPTITLLLISDGKFHLKVKVQKRSGTAAEWMHIGGSTASPCRVHCHSPSAASVQATFHTDSFYSKTTGRAEP